MSSASVRLLSGSYLYADTERVFCGFPVYGASSDAEAAAWFVAAEPSATEEIDRHLAEIVANADGDYSGGSVAAARVLTRERVKS